MEQQLPGTRSGRASGGTFVTSNAEQWLTVVDRVSAAAGVVLVTLADPSGAELPRWQPGAHLEIVLASGLVRHYSLCGDPDDRQRYTVAVLRVADGRGGSREIHDSDLVGQQLLVRGPRNHFGLGEADHYLFLAGGIGITPIMAMVQAAEVGHRDWRLIYGGRSRAAMAFWDRLAALAPDRVEFVPEDELGYPDLETAIKLAEAGTAVYACGPAGMLEAVESTAETYAARVTLHVERFTTSETVRATDGNTEFEVELARSGRVLTVPADKTILEVVLGVVPNHPYSCTEGICGSCETTVLAGIPDHRDEVLSESERSTNETMMICVGRSLTPRLTLDL